LSLGVVLLVPESRCRLCAFDADADDLRTGGS
jgi:hypothetical protein